MTNKKTEKVVYETHDGEIFDVDGAFKRHPAITPGKANIDLTVNIERHTGLYFELRLSDKAMAHLVQILNAAPVNGDPLNVTVNLEIDSTASDRAREKITTPTIYETRFIVSAPSGALIFCADGKRMGEFEGEEYGGYRIVKIFTPGGFASNGGVIMERIKEGDD